MLDGRLRPIYTSQTNDNKPCLLGFVWSVCYLVWCLPLVGVCLVDWMYLHFQAELFSP